MTARLKGHDYRRGVDLELTGAEWRALLSGAAYIRRIGNGVLGYVREEGRSLLAFEVYDEGAVNLSRREQRK